MNVSRLVNKVGIFLKKNSSEILTVVAGAGVVGTGYLSASAGYHTAMRLESEAPDMPLKEKAKIAWDLYIPPVLVGGVTIASLVGSSKINKKRTAAAVTAYSLTEKAFSEYREKIVEQLGEKKEQKIRDEIKEERIKSNPPKVSEIIIAGAGHVLCCELYTNRYFRCDMEKLRKAQNDINAKLFSQDQVTLDDLYDALGLPYTTVSGNNGWSVDRLLELEFSTVMSENDEPCIAFEYNYVKPLF